MHGQDFGDDQALVKNGPVGFVKIAGEEGRRLPVVGEGDELLGLGLPLLVGHVVVKIESVVGVGTTIEMKFKSA